MPWKAGKTLLRDEGEHREMALEISGAEQDVHAWVDFALGEKLGLWAPYWNVQDDEQTKKKLILFRAVSPGFSKGEKQRDVLVRLAVASVPGVRPQQAPRQVPLPIAFH